MGFKRVVQTALVCEGLCPPEPEMVVHKLGRNFTVIDRHIPNA